MFKNFRFDYDYVNDSLFLYHPSLKSNASIELDDLIVDLTSKKEISGFEFLGATKFFKGLDIKVTKGLLRKMTSCKIDMLPKDNFVMIRFLFSFEDKSKISTPLMVPLLTKSSPALA